MCVVLANVINDLLNNRNRLEPPTIVENSLCSLFENFSKFTEIFTKLENAFVRLKVTPSSLTTTTKKSGCSRPRQMGQWTMDATSIWRWMEDGVRCWFHQRIRKILPTTLSHTYIYIYIQSISLNRIQNTYTYTYTYMQFYCLVFYHFSYKIIYIRKFSLALSSHDNRAPFAIHLGQDFGYIIEGKFQNIL